MESLLAEQDPTTWIGAAERLLDNGLGVFFSVVFLGLLAWGAWAILNRKDGVLVEHFREMRKQDRETDTAIVGELTRQGRTVDDLHQMAGEAKAGDASRDNMLAGMNDSDRRWAEAGITACDAAAKVAKNLDVDISDELASIKAKLSHPHGA